MCLQGCTVQGVLLSCSQPCSWLRGCSYLRAACQLCCWELLRAGSGSFCREVRLSVLFQSRQEFHSVYC